MEQVMSYVKPELLAVAVVLYFCGIGLKRIQIVKDNYIPVILGGAGMIVFAGCGLATCPLSNIQDIAMAVFTSIVQGVLVAGLSTYVNQMIKQANKAE